MPVPRAAVEQYERQQVIAAITVKAMLRIWRQAGPDFEASWMAVRRPMLARLQLGRAASVHAAMQYTSTVLEATGQRGTPFGALIPSAFLEAEPNGMPVGTTLDSVPVKAKVAIRSGASVAEALAAASTFISGVGLTNLADTRRDVYQADMVQRPRVTGYVRMLNPPSCARCVILAGKRFQWNQGFRRHPRCDCIHIPASESVAGDMTVDPYAYFNSLSEKDQAKYFGKVQAQAVRDGADIYRVVNLGQKGLGTAAGNARYGTPFKRTLEDIYKRGGSREIIISNLEYHGWITGPQTAGGNIIGNDPLGRILAAGRGQGTYRVGSEVVTTARAARFDAAMTGTRDPLNRATMTAAEKRLYDAHYRAEWAKAGYRPNSVGANSADRGLGLRPIAPDETQRAYERLRIELAALDDPESGIPDSVRDLARILGY